MFIGNDIINLNDDYISEKLKNKSWIKKCFNLEEVEYIFDSANPKLTLWQLWSCKESAYKIYVKNKNKRFLNAQKLQISNLNKGSAYQVNCQEMIFYTRSTITSKYIHTTSCDKFLDTDIIQKQVYHFPDIELKEGSRMLKRLLISKLDKLYGKEAIHLEKNSFGVPKIFPSDINVDISFSHDEPYYAFAFVANKLE